MNECLYKHKQGSVPKIQDDQELPSSFVDDGEIRKVDEWAKNCSQDDPFHLPHDRHMRNRIVPELMTSCAYCVQ